MSLDLPPHMHLYLTFHVSPLMEPYVIYLIRVIPPLPFVEVHNKLYYLINCLDYTPNDQLQNTK